MIISGRKPLYLRLLGIDLKEVVMMLSKGCMPSCILCMLFIIICACANFNLLLFVHC